MKERDREEMLAEMEAQEAELQFEHFSNEDALALGQSFVETARSRALAVTIDISRHDQQLFHYACPGTSADNDQWIIRKNRVVARFGHSSLSIGTRLAREGVGIDERYFLSPFEYSPFGGAFPITLRGTGVVGTVTVSGLPQESDHALVVEVLRTFLKKD